MTQPIKRIGVLTGGGDCPGLNAVIRAVTKTAITEYRLEVMGIADGFLGLLENHIHPLNNHNVSNILTLGGTILGTNNKCDPRRFAVKDNGGIRHVNRVPDGLRNLKAAGIDALIVIGGDGTMSVACDFVAQGINCIGVPKTIDNDLEGTDVTFGFGTAVAIATDALDRIHTTAASHHRAMVVEVMGRNAGWIALYAGVASGADVILLPEIPYDIDAVCRFITARKEEGKHFSILSVSEGAKPRHGEQVVAKIDPMSPEPIRLGGVGEKVANDIAARLDIETRTTVLGHVQRGGTPIPADRILATEFGSRAVHLLMEGQRNRMVVMKGRVVEDIDITQVANKQRTVPVDHPLIVAARGLGTCFGE
jgi:6-phosphofructokinase 1